MKKGIIFDMDGTLWDSSEAVAKSWSSVTEKDYGVTITGEQVRSVMGKPMDELADILFTFATKEERGGVLKKCGDVEIEYLKNHGANLYPEVEETFIKLREKYNLYIVSNCQSGYIEAFLEFYNLGKYIDDFECFGNNNLGKRDNIKKVVERNNLDKAVYVGDIMGDYVSTMEAGIDFIHAAYGFGIVDENVEKIKTFSDLVEIAPKVLD